MWSFMKKKSEKYWVGLAMDQTPRASFGWIVGCHIGRRDSKDAKALQERGDYYTDFWGPYMDVLPKDRHYPVGKETGLTNHIERFNCSLRQRASRLVRKTLSFSKNIQNHEGAIWNFIHHYNSSLA